MERLIIDSIKQADNKVSFEVVNEKGDIKKHSVKIVDKKGNTNPLAEDVLGRKERLEIAEQELATAKANSYDATLDATLESAVVLDSEKTNIVKATYTNKEGDPMYITYTLRDENGNITPQARKVLETSAAVQVATQSLESAKNDTEIDMKKYEMSGIEKALIAVGGIAAATILIGLIAKFGGRETTLDKTGGAAYSQTIENQEESKAKDETDSKEKEDKQQTKEEELAKIEVSIPTLKTYSHDEMIKVYENMLKEMEYAGVYDPTAPNAVDIQKGLIYTTTQNFLQNLSSETMQELVRDGIIPDDGRTSLSGSASGIGAIYGNKAILENRGMGNGINPDLSVMFPEGSNAAKDAQTFYALIATMNTKTPEEIVDIAQQISDFSKNINDVTAPNALFVTKIGEQPSEYSAIMYQVATFIVNSEAQARLSDEAAYGRTDNATLEWVNKVLNEAAKGPDSLLKDQSDVITLYDQQCGVNINQGKSLN